MRAIRRGLIIGLAIVLVACLGGIAVLDLPIILLIALVVMMRFFSILFAVAFLQDPVGHLQHEVHVLRLHLAGAVEEHAQAWILVECFETLFIFVILQTVFGDKVGDSHAQKVGKFLDSVGAREFLPVAPVGCGGG